jgi:uncharacterized protein YjiS (DUF1127 family)
MAILQSARPTTSILAQALQSFLPVFGHLAEALRRRQIRRSYGNMSDALLKDIGLTRWELEVALSLPLDRDAGDALAIVAAIEADRW